MKNLYLLFICLMSILAYSSCSENKPIELSVMTLNIRIDSPADGLNNWKYRKDNVAQKVKEYKADIFGAQEVMANQLKDLQDRLPDYSAVGIKFEDAAKNNTEFCPLFYNKNKLKALETGTFRLSETPDSVGSRGWDAMYERVATCAFLEDLKTGKKIFAVNTHLDHRGEQARINGIKLVIQKAKEIGGDTPLVLMGDFNAWPDSETIFFAKDENNPDHLLVTREHAKINKDAKWTFHDFGRWAIEKRGYFDYIFVSQGTEVLEHEVLPEKVNDVYISDHMPVFAKLLIK